jgi:hypothetical protein
MISGPEVARETASEVTKHIGTLPTCIMLKSLRTEKITIVQ